MSDHVALSVDQIVQLELEAGNQAGSSELGAESELKIRSQKLHSTDVGIVVGGYARLGLACDSEIQTHELKLNRDHAIKAKTVGLGVPSKGYSILPNEEVGVVPLIKGDEDSVDCCHVVVPIASLPQFDKKDIENPGFAECRICQEEDDIANLESPCACSGSLKFAHRKCVQHWCNEKGDTVCEICQKSFEGGYVTPQQGRAENSGIEMGAGWDIASAQPRLFTLAADHHFSEGDFDEYAGLHAQNAACFRSIALILMAFLLLKHIISMTGVGEDEDQTTFFMLSVVRAAGFLIPCYIMVRAMNALQIRHQQQEAAIAAAADVTHLIQTGRIQAVVAAES